MQWRNNSLAASGHRSHPLIRSHFRHFCIPTANQPHSLSSFMCRIWISMCTARNYGHRNGLFTHTITTYLLVLRRWWWWLMLFGATTVQLVNCSGEHGAFVNHATHNVAHNVGAERSQAFTTLHTISNEWPNTNWLPYRFVPPTMEMETLSLTLWDGIGWNIAAVRCPPPPKKRSV